MSAPELVEHFFRHEYGRLVATLSRRVGVQHLEAVEDAVQSALMTALESWTTSGLPNNPAAWLSRVAHNELLGELRKETRRRRILEQSATTDLGATADGADIFLAGEVQDDLLRMLFVCCDEAIPLGSRLVLALKTLCGFDVREIALRLFTSEANVYKRLGRARGRLREHPPRTDQPLAQLSARLSAVHTILYVLFTEGYLSSNVETAIRRELCGEAIRLATILAEHPVGRSPETFALLALMHLHTARIAARQDASGGLLLLEEQDRSIWDRRTIEVGLSWLALSAQGDVFSRYHAEAAIAAEHCLAPSAQDTRWDRVVDCYSLLEQSAPSPLHTLNRAVAVAEWRTGRGARAPGQLRATSVARRVVPVGGRAFRPASALRNSRRVPALSGFGRRVGSYSGREGAPGTATRVGSRDEPTASGRPRSGQRSLNRLGKRR